MGPKYKLNFWVSLSKSACGYAQLLMHNIEAKTWIHLRLQIQ